MKRCFFTTILILASLASFAQKKEVVILTVNDIHAAIGNFPKMSDVVDSLREIYPQMLIFSAGDNRTGNAISDKYKDPSYPVTALMNQIGVSASAIGNHEFDNNTSGLRHQMRRSNFRYLCANVQCDDSLNMRIPPCQFFDVEGVKVGVLGVLQINSLGIPDSHPKNLNGLHFRHADEVIKEYEWMRKQCDVMVLLSHDGYYADIATAKKYPWIDVILGGHSHTAVPENTFYSDVLIAQSKDKLKLATLVKIELQDGKIVNRSSEQIDIANHQGSNELVQSMIDFFSDNDALKQQVCMSEQEITNAEEFGCMMTDAYREEAKTDIGFQNGGGVRLSSFPAGPITVYDVLQLDPFSNECVVYNITGKELGDLIMECWNIDEHTVPYVSGITYEMFIDSDDTAYDIVMRTPDGKKLNLKKTYTVSTNSYVSAICKTGNAEPTGTICSDCIQEYLRKKGSVDYFGQIRTKITRK